MFDFLNAYVNGKVVHKDRYVFRVMNVETNKLELIYPDKVLTTWRKELIPVEIIYHRTYDYGKWKLYRDNKHIQCNSSCEHYKQFELSDGNIFEVCKINHVILNYNNEFKPMAGRHEKCPKVYSPWTHKLG